MSTTSMQRVHDMIDFHSHHVPPEWAPTTTVGKSGRELEHWERVNRRLSDVTALLENIRAGDIAGRVVNMPAALIAGADGAVAAETYRTINDRLAAIVAAHPDCLTGLASVDAFGGDGAATEVTRAVRELGLRGVFLDCARGDRLLDCPESRPVLTAAAAAGVPVFAHPIDPEPFATRMRRHGRIGGFLARGTINAAALIALIESGVFEELPSLKVVVTTLGIAGILMEGAFAQLSTRPDAAGILRRHVYVDTMGLNPVLIRACVDFLGAEHVLLGSDWPIVSDGPIGERAASALAAAGLSETEKRKIASENARSLLAWPEPADARRSAAMGVRA